MSEKRYKIIVKTIQDKFLVFTVSEYLSENGRIIFTDEVTGVVQNHDGRNCDIKEILKVSQ